MVIKVKEKEREKTKEIHNVKPRTVNIKYWCIECSRNSSENVRIFTDVFQVPELYCSYCKKEMMKKI